MTINAVDERLLLDLARDMADRLIAPRAEAIDASHEFPADVAAELRAAGFLSFAVPESDGGFGGTARQLAQVAEILGNADTSSTMIFTLQCTCTEVISGLARAEQKGRLFERIVDGELLALALTEPEAGSDAAGLRMTAELRGDRYVLNGTKRYITNGERASMLITFASTTPGAGARGISAFVVDNPSPGLHFVRNEEKMGLNGTTTDEIVFDDAEVPVENLLGEADAGFRAGMRALEKGRVSIGAVAVGLAQRALDEAVRHTSARKQFGVPVGTFQGVQFKLADMAIEIAAARALVHAAADLADAGDPTFRSVSAMAKCFATDVAMRVATDAVQVHGGAGYIRGVPVERLMRDAKILQIFEGTNEIMRVLVARSLQTGSGT